MTTAQIALSVIMIVASLFLIVVVLLQHGAQQGLGAVSGSADTFYGSGKASASDRIFARLTSIVQKSAALQRISGSILMNVDIIGQPPPIVKWEAAVLFSQKVLRYAVSRPATPQCADSKGIRSASPSCVRPVSDR